MTKWVDKSDKQNASTISVICKVGSKDPILSVNIADIMLEAPYSNVLSEIDSIMLREDQVMIIIIFFW